jgi:hypothetical protein
MAMDNSSEYAKASAPSTAATLHSLIDSVRNWLDSFLDLVVLEGKKAGIGLALMFEFGVGATALSITGWLALVYYSAQIFLFGAEYTWVYANRHGSRVPMPSPSGRPAVPCRHS